MSPMTPPPNEMIGLRRSRPASQELVVEAADALQRLVAFALRQQADRRLKTGTTQALRQRLGIGFADHRIGDDGRAARR